ncbi:MAG: glycosyltransferase [Candidatus Nanopelagicales bacterium]
MTNARILVMIPTHRGGPLLPFAVRSALWQDLPAGVSLRVVIIGDGVDDLTRAAAQELSADPLVTFVDHPKGERHGEAYRNEFLQTAEDDVVVYLGEDDLLAPDHVASALDALSHSDFCYPLPVFWVGCDEFERFIPVDLTDDAQRDYIRNRTNRISLSGVAHTVVAYRRLPRGWEPALTGKWSDWHMWHQWLDVDALRMVCTWRFTSIKLARSTAVARSRSAETQLADRQAWEELLLEPDWRARLDAMFMSNAQEWASADMPLQLRTITMAEQIAVLRARVDVLDERLAHNREVRRRLRERTDEKIAELREERLQLRAELRAARAQIRELQLSVRDRIKRRVRRMVDSLGTPDES